MSPTETEIPRSWKESRVATNALVFATMRSFRLQDADTLDAVQTIWLRLVENTRCIRQPDYFECCSPTTPILTAKSLPSPESYPAESDPHEPRIATATRRLDWNFATGLADLPVHKDGRPIMAELSGNAAAAYSSFPR